MADITKTNHKGLGLPKHFDPSMEQMKKNMEVIDDILQKAVPNDLTSITDTNAEPNINALTETGRYLVKSNATGYPISEYAGVVDVFRAGAYILQEWRSINASTYVYRRYSSNSGSSWNSWIKEWNANNDGSGSGLDADTLDGLNSQAFSRVYNKTTTDFNNATSVGFWCINDSTNAPNTSGSLWGCIVFSTDISSGNSSTWLCQIAIKDDTEGNTLYYRKKNGSSWSSWQTIWSTSSEGSGSGLDADQLDGRHFNELPYVPVTVSTSGTENIDSYQTDGFYSLTEVSSATTLPTFLNSNYSGYGLLVKLSKGSSSYDCCHQLLFRDGSDEIYIRHYHGGTWSPWVQVGGTASDLLTKIKTVDGSSSGLDSDLLDGQHEYQMAKYGDVSGTLPTTGDPTSTSTGGCQMFRFKDSSNLIGEGADRYYGIIQIYYSSSYYTRIAVSMTSGKVYRQTSSQTAWNEITPLIPVVTSDPTSPSEGQLWILAE